MLGVLDKVRIGVSAGLNAERRATFGQFMTPSAVAHFMASLFPAAAHKKCRLLDPGAGMGSLCGAFLERCKQGSFDFDEVSVSAFEIDDTLRGYLEANLAQYTNTLGVSATVYNGDFIAAAAGCLAGDLFEHALQPFTHAILNPPYKKIGAHSLHRLALRRLGIETVNLYSAFVALSLEMLEPGGHLIAIIPRSFCNGPYYKPFRDLILSTSAIRRLHLFKARDRAFRDDGVLQENIIIHLERSAKQGDVLVSTSTDEQLDDCKLHAHPFNRIVFPNDSERFIHVPTTPENDTIEMPPAFHYSLCDLDIQVSTGPVVDFRMREHIRQNAEDGAAPLLYPGHFGAKYVEWPKPEGRKPNAILRNKETEKWLYPTGFYTVVRRFSSKEERRRIVANVVCPSVFDTPVIGFENHLNVFHFKRRGLPECLAWGLDVFLNSTVMDINFRRFNGHTQVNATDLRSMKYPSREMLMQLGRWAVTQKELTQEAIDSVLENIS